MGRISALAVALSLGLMTTAEAEDWTGLRLTFGLGNTAIDFRSDDGSPVTEAGRKDDWSPYFAMGYDWAYGDLTLGLSADVEGVSVQEDLLSGGKGFTGESDWFATLRARVGMPLNDRTHVYASGGLAAMGMFSSQVGGLFGTEHKTLTGAAAGIGMEYMLSPGRNLSLEYLHADFGETEFHDGALTRNPAVDTVRLGYTLRF